MAMMRAAVALAMIAQASGTCLCTPRGKSNDCSAVRTFDELIEVVKAKPGIKAVSCISTNPARPALLGGMPAEIGDLTGLETLHIEGAKVGELRPELGKLTTLKKLVLPNNDLSGSIPPELGDMTALEELNLNNNGLQGTIPPELGKLSNLVSLELWRNELAGELPSEIGDLTKLVSLWLNENKLTGRMPAELGDLTNLEKLVVSKNDFTGPPASLEKLNKLQSLYVLSPRSCGKTPAYVVPPQNPNDYDTVFMRKFHTDLPEPDVEIEDCNKFTDAPTTSPSVAPTVGPTASPTSAPSATKSTGAPSVDGGDDGDDDDDSGGDDDDNNDDEDDESTTAPSTSSDNDKDSEAPNGGSGLVASAVGPMLLALAALALE